jgi:hypothetical protein
LVKSRPPRFTCIVAKGFQQPQGACRHYVRSILSLVEAHAHVRLRPQVVNLIGLDLLEQTIEVGCVCQVAVMQVQRCPFLVRIRIDLIETIRIESGGPANDAMHLVPFGEQELGEIGSILSRDAGDEGPRSSFHRNRSQALLQPIWFQLLSAPGECAGEHARYKTRLTYDKPPHIKTRPPR